MDINWKKHFDAVYCLSLADNRKRREDVVKELRRVGIVQGRLLNMKITVKNAFYKYIWKNQQLSAERWWLNNETALNCTMGHYEIMKECLAIGYKRVLIVEDDIKFLKDTNAIKEIIGNTPDCDIVLYDKCIPISKEPYLKAVEENRINEHFVDFSNVKLWGTGCFALTDKAMGVMTKNQERIYIPADHVTNRVNNAGRVINDDGLTRAAAIKNVAVQDFKYKKERTEADNEVYRGIVDLKEYNI